MEFSLIIPWRTDNGYRQEVFNWIMNRWQTLYEDTDVEFVIGDSRHQKFSRSASRNQAFSMSKKDIVVIADADTVPIKGFVNAAVQRAAQGNWCVAYDKLQYYNLAQVPTEEYLRGNPAQWIKRPEPGDFEHKVTSWAGMIAMPRAAYEKIEGYDERFQGWGWEDNAFTIKMDAEWGPHVRIQGGYAVHLWHPRGEADFNNRDEMRNRELFNKEYRRKYRWVDERIHV